MRIGLRGEDDDLGRGGLEEGFVVLEAVFQRHHPGQFVDPHEATGEQPQSAEPDVLGDVLVERASAVVVLRRGGDKQAVVGRQARVRDRRSSAGA